MAYEMNRATIAGHLTKDPEIRYTQGDDPICIAACTLAVNRPGRNGGADFIPCKVFGKQAENFVEKYLRKGSPVMVEGRIETGSFTKKDGSKGSRFDVIGERISSGKEGNLNFNYAAVCGNLTRDPSIMWTADSRVAKFGIAVKRRPKKGAQEPAGVDFIDCTAFGKVAETAEKYLSKGKGVLISGHIRTGSYVNREGATVYTTDLVAEDIRFLYSRSGEETRDTQAAGSAPASGAGQTSPQDTAHQYEGGNAPGEADGLFDGLDGFVNIPDGEDDELPFN